MPQAFGVTLYSKQSKQFDRVLGILKRAEDRGQSPYPHHKLLSSMSRYVSSKELKEIVTTLDEQRDIDIILNFENRKGAFYRLHRKAPSP